MPPASGSSCVRNRLLLQAHLALEKTDYCDFLIAVLLFFGLYPISVANCKKGGIVIYTALVIIISILSAMWGN